MKYITLIIIVLICIAAGVLRFFDLIYYTDEQGFSTYLDSTVRYIVILAIILLIVVQAVFFNSKIRTLSSRYTIYIVMLITGLVHIAIAVLISAILFSSHISTIQIILTSMMLFTGLWFTISSVVSIKIDKIFTCGIIISLLASVYYYGIMINNFISTASSTDRVSTVLGVLIPMSVVVFITSYIKHLYFSNGSCVMVQISGMICFLFSGCLGTAEVINGIINGTVFTVPMLEYIAYMSIGLLAVCVTFSFNKTAAKTRQVPVY